MSRLRRAASRKLRARLGAPTQGAVTPTPHPHVPSRAAGAHARGHCDKRMHPPMLASCHPRRIKLPNWNAGRGSSRLRILLAVFSRWNIRSRELGRTRRQLPRVGEEEEYYSSLPHFRRQPSKATLSLPRRLPSASALLFPSLPHLVIVLVLATSIEHLFAKRDTYRTVRQVRHRGISIAISACTPPC